MLLKKRKVVHLGQLTFKITRIRSRGSKRQLCQPSAAQRTSAIACVQRQRNTSSWNTIFRGE